MFNICYDYKLKLVEIGLEKGGINFSYDGTPDWEKESSVNKNKEKCTS